VDIKVNSGSGQQDIQISSKLFAKTKELANDGKIDPGELNQLLRLAGDKGKNSTINHDEAVFLASLNNNANVEKIKEGTSESSMQLTLEDETNLPEMNKLTELKGKGFLQEINARESSLAEKDNKAWMDGMKGVIEKYSQASAVSCVTSSFFINSILNHDDTLKLVKGMNKELSGLMSKSDDVLKATFSNSSLHSHTQLENWRDYTLAPIMAKVMASPPEALTKPELKALDELFTHLNNYEKKEDTFLIAGKNSMQEAVEGLQKKIGADPGFNKQLKHISTALKDHNLEKAAKLLGETIGNNNGGNSSVTAFENVNGKQYVIFSEGDILAKKYGFGLKRPSQQEVDALAGNDKKKIAEVFANMKDGEVLRMVAGSEKTRHSVNIRRIGDNFLYIDPMNNNRSLTPKSADELAETIHQPYKIDSKVQMNPAVNL
jgi:hypothetical protein